MTAATADDKKRVRIPDARPGQVVSIKSNRDGSWTLVPLNAERKERFPRGSLLKYFTAEKNAVETEIAKGFVQGPE